MGFVETVGARSKEPNAPCDRAGSGCREEGMLYSDPSKSLPVWFGECPMQSSFPSQKRGQLWAVSLLIAWEWVLACPSPVVMLLPKLNSCSLPESIFNHF